MHEIRVLNGRKEFQIYWKWQEQFLQSEKWTSNTNSDQNKGLEYGILSDSHLRRAWGIGHVEIQHGTYYYYSDPLTRPKWRKKLGIGQRIQSTNSFRCCKAQSMVTISVNWTMISFTMSMGLITERIGFILHQKIVMSYLWTGRRGMQRRSCNHSHKYLHVISHEGDQL